MTCIVGLVEGNSVLIGADSAGVSGSNIIVRKDPKVFKKGKFLIGFTGSFRVGQLLMSSKFKPPTQKKNQSDFDYMVVDFVDFIRELFSDSGSLRKKDNKESGSFFLVGYKGMLYHVQSDFQISMTEDPYSACGSGQRIALGAMYALKDSKISSKKKILLALEASARYTTSVCAPFRVLKSTFSKT